MNIEIKHRWTNACLWSGEAESVKDAVVQALVGANLSGANLRGAALSGAALRDAALSGADLRDADLSGAYLRDANLRDADLSGAALRGAALRGANLNGADLRDANLRGANLNGADLRDANLRGANLSGANLPDGFRIARLDFGGWSICATPDKTSIGCQTHPNSNWLTWEPDDERIVRMAPGAGNFWERHKDAVRAVIRDVMAPAGT